MIRKAFPARLFTFSTVALIPSHLHGFPLHAVMGPRPSYFTALATLNSLSLYVPFYLCKLQKLYECPGQCGLAGWASSMHQKVAGSFPCQDTCPCLRLDPRKGEVQGAGDLCITFTSMFLTLFLPSPPFL